jgi:hypothetical protein
MTGYRGHFGFSILDFGLPRAGIQNPKSKIENCGPALALALSLAVLGSGCSRESAAHAGARRQAESTDASPANSVAKTSGEQPSASDTKTDQPVLATAAGSRLTVESKPPAPVPATKEITFDEVKLDMKKGDPYDSSLLTEKVKKLDGKPIRIRGYILPSFKQSGLKQFVLVRDNQECCFGPGALLHDCIVVEMMEPATAEFSVRPVSVEGVFSIRELKLDGKYLAIYHLDGKEVK